MAYYNPQLTQYGMLMIASSAATMSVQASTPVPVVSGVSYTAFAYFIAVTTGRACSVGIKWLNSTGGTISTSTSGTTNDTTAGWIQITETAIAPAGAVNAVLVLTVTSPANAEQHYVATVSLAITKFFDASYFVPSAGPGGVHQMREITYNQDGTLAAIS